MNGPDGHSGATSTETGSSGHGPVEAAYPSPRLAGYIVAVLMLVTLTSLLDRYLPSIMVEPMKAELSLSDTRISLIQGLAFSFFYCLAGIPLGRLIDRRNRRNLVIAAVLTWTSLTIWSGLAQSFVELFIARAGVGIAEAALAPAAYSIIADCYPAHQRGRAIAVYFTSLTFGASASFILGGVLLKLFSTTPLVLPLLGRLEPWRATFIATALVGVPAALLTMTFREPARHGAALDPALVQDGRSALGAFLKLHARSMSLLFATYGFLAFLTVIGISWATALYARSFGMPSSRAAMILGVATLVGGVGGALAAGVVSDRWAQRGSGSGRFLVPVLALAASAPLVVAWALMPVAGLSVVLFFLVTAVISFGTSSSAVVIQDIAPYSLRGQLIAINQIVMTLALGISPTFVALVTDRVFADPAALPWSIALTAGVFGSIGALVGMAALAPYAAMRVAPAEPGAPWASPASAGDGGVSNR